MGSGYHYQQHQSQRIHEQVTLAPAQFLGPIIATHAPLFTGPHRLAVQHRATGLALSSGRLPHPLAHGVMDSLPNSLPAPGPKVMIDRTPRGQIVGQQFPRAAAANGVTDPIDDRATRVFGRTPSGFGCGHERFQAIPFRIRKIRIVGSTLFHVDRLRDYLFKRALRETILSILDTIECWNASAEAQALAAQQLTSRGGVAFHFDLAAVADMTDDDMLRFRRELS